jgi:hypothetical protein
VTTINTEISTSHPGSAISKHEDSRRLEILGGTQAAQQSATHPGLLDFGLSCSRASVIAVRMY